uniref:ATPbinding Cassette (ABC) Superfamily putative n=1 Tax=Albugo laibachii Nc14 TaxID=890382 RepID=F0WNT5_9STRA|nr:ATPbinding Cassette (ABC) Superfamily putative [Albugo laibachii Nc14]|eukprot:CCA22977.1 ATPbinding Cassette (ABC) Superfamily putative [Albugo laibachii Nc14]
MQNILLQDLYLFIHFHSSRMHVRPLRHLRHFHGPFCSSWTRFRPFFTLPTISTTSSIYPYRNKPHFHAKSPKNRRGISTDIICHLRDVGVTIPGGKTLFDNLGMNFIRGAKIGILGSNGSGKSTLLKIIAGVRSDFDGDRWIKDETRVGYLPQEPVLDPSKTVYENIMDGLTQCQSLMSDFDRISAEMGEPDADFDRLLEEQGELQERIDQLGCWELSHEIDRAMQALRVPPKESSVVTLSGGERRRVALCRLLLEKPDILLLDEPTNHLDATSVAWLEAYLMNYKGTVIAVTHDRYFLDNVVGWILELDRGKTFAYEGNYSKWLEQKQNRLNTQQKSDIVRSKQIAKELEWTRAHQGNKKGNKARTRKLESMDATRQSRITEGQIVIPSGPRLGTKVIRVCNVSKRIPENNRILFEKVNFEVSPNSIVGIVGGNGTGKSTLLKVIAGIEEPDEGFVELGKTVSLGVVSQTRDELHSRKTVYETISQDNDIVELEGGERMHARAYIAAFNLRGPMQERYVATLSGGERNRVHLAQMLLGGHNVILLDEPTNDLDMETLRSLETALAETFEGVALVISHDRYFLDRICTHIIAFEDGKVRFFDGNYSEYERSRSSKKK